MRKKFVLGNWKMNKTVKESIEAVNELVELLKDYEGEYIWGIAPPFTSLFAVSSSKGKVRFLLGAQNCHHEKTGPYTGEVSPLMLYDIGVDFVILGHSERRIHFGETDALISRKVRAVLDFGMIPVLCVGERLEEREGGATFEVVKAQLSGSLALIEPNLISSVVIAYEPIWAIGTGRTATPKTAQEVHQFIRETLVGMGADASEVSVIYGGSVKPDNIRELTEMSDIDGVLVGGASLKPESFANIIHFAK